MHGIMQHTTRLTNLVLVMAITSGGAIGCATSKPPAQNREMVEIGKVSAPVSATQKTIMGFIEALLIQGLIK